METIRNEFKKNQFNFTHDKPEDFAVYSWQSDRKKISGYFVAYRLFLASLFLSILVSHGSLNKTPKYFFIYATNLGLIIQTLHLVVSALFLIEALLRKNNYGLLRWTVLGQCSWFLYNVVNFTSVAITAIYWGFLFKPGNGLEAMDFMIHGFNSIITIIDILVSGRPCRLMHFYNPFIFWILYISFSLIYWAVGGVSNTGQTYIYSVLDWNNLSLTVPFVIISFFVALPVVHALLWGLHQLRDFVIRKCVQGTSSEKISLNGNSNFGFVMY